MKLHMKSIELMKRAGIKPANHSDGTFSYTLTQDFDTFPWACMIALRVLKDGSPEHRVYSASEQSLVVVSTRWAHEVIKSWPKSSEEIEALCGDANDGVDNPGIERVLRRG